MSVASGQVIKSYRVIEQIDSGGFGAVYRAFQPVVEREVAIKVILPAFANEPAFIRRFESEAQLVARLEHPHIVPLYDYWRDSEGAYLVMRWLRGGSVRKLLPDNPLSFDDASRLVDQIAGALNVAHRNRVVHRDIKPENILMDEDNNFYLSDFGISTHVDQDSTSDTVSGSAKYIAPEQLQSQSPSIRSDIYSFGIVLFELLTGQHPFGTTNLSEMIYKQLTDPLPSILTINPAMPETVDLVIQRATQKNPLDRYKSIVAFATAFREAVGLQRSTIEMRPIIDPADIDNPYKGLRSFYEADAADFFGREALVNNIIRRLETSDSNFLALVGPSGSGKSSVIRAGVIPALRQHSITNFEGWYVADMVPGSTPIDNLYAELISIAVDPPPNLKQRLRRTRRGLVDAVDEMLAQMGGNILLLIDQFEELFIQVEDDAIRRQFLDLIFHAVYQSKGRLFIIVSIRADFFDKPLMYDGIGDLIQEHTQVVLPLSAEEIERAITGPARRVGLEIDTDLIAAIVADVREEPGALPLLQYALTELFERRDGNHLTIEAYHASGGVQGALARRAEEVYQDLDDDLKPLVQQVILRLVTLGEGSEDTRRRARQSELLALTTDREAINEVISAFGQYRLLTFDRDATTREPTIEIAHEALIRNWGLLKEWLAESRSDIRLQRALNQAAQEWQAHGQDTGYLLYGGRLIQYEEWAMNSTIALTDLETRFLDASVAERIRREEAEAERLAREAELEARSRRLLQIALGVFAVFGLVAFGLAVIAVQQGQAAQEQSITAEAAAQEALVARETSDANAIEAQEQLELANERAAEIQNLNLLNRAEDALLAGDNGLAMALVLNVANSDNLSPEIINMLYEVAYSGSLRARLTGHSTKITALALSPDGRWLATGSEDTQVILWNIATGEQVTIFTDHRGPINSLTFSDDSTLLASAATDGTANIWHTETLELVSQLRGHRGALTDIDISPDGSRLVTSSADDTVRVWDMASESPILQFDEHEDTVRTTAIHPNGNSVLSAGRDEVLILWNIETGEVFRRFNGHEGEVQSVIFLADGTRALSAGSDGTVIYWNVEVGAPIRRFDRHSDIVTSVAYDEASGLAVSTSCAQRNANRACLQGEVILWRVSTGQEIRRLVGHFDSANAVAFSVDGSLIYSASCADLRQANCAVGEVLVWDTVLTDDIEYSLTAHESSVFTVAINPNERYAVTAGGTRATQQGGDTRLLLWDLTTGDLVREFAGHTDDVNSVVFSADNASIFSASNDTSIRQWDIETGDEVRRFEGHSGAVVDLAISPDGRQLLSAGTDRMIRWDVASGREQQSFTDLGGANLRALAVAFNPAGDTFVSGLNNGTIILWNGFGQEIRRYIGHTDDIHALSFSPDGRFILSGSEDRTARLWNVRTGEIIQVYQGHEAAVMGVALNPRATQFLSVSTDNTMRLWDVTSGDLIRIFNGHSDDVFDLALSRSGSIAVTASVDGTAQVWRISIDTLIAWVENNRYRRDFTEQEIENFQIMLPDSDS